MTCKSLKFSDGTTASFSMENHGIVEVWGHTLGWTIETKYLEEALKIISEAMRLFEQNHPDGVKK